MKNSRGRKSENHKSGRIIKAGESAEIYCLHYYLNGSATLIAYVFRSPKSAFPIVPTFCGEKTIKIKDLKTS
jgi:hypothetical protein